MATPGTGSKQSKKNAAGSATKKKSRTTGSSKSKSLETTNSSGANSKETEEHYKKVHAAAKEAQDAVRKALENTAQQSDYKE